MVPTRALHRQLWVVPLCVPVLAGAVCLAGEPPQRTYVNRLTRLADPKPLLADYPEFLEPVREAVHYDAPPLVDEAGADLSVRAWRFSYNARGLIEIPNRLRSDRTALIVVHPWGIDDGQGWNTPEPAGVADFCTPEKNRINHKHVKQVLNPFLKSLRGKVSLVMYSLPGPEDPIRKKVYRSIHGRPTEQERREGAKELTAKLKGFSYKGEPVPAKLPLSRDRPVVDYFREFPGLDAGPRFNNAGYWDLPIPVISDIETVPDDVVIYDQEGYEPLKKFLNGQGVRHVLLTGYATDMCLCRTTAGYMNLCKDFNVFIVGDATMATFPANASPRTATTAALSFASIDHLITQVSLVRYRGKQQADGARKEESQASRK